MFTAVLMWSALAGGAGNADSKNRVHYVGSKTCADCHADIYDTRQSTRHNYSLLSVEEVKATGYPLPQTVPTGKKPLIWSWDQCGYVLGDRQRIA